MNFIRQLWNNFKAQPDIWFFYGFLLSFTLSVRKVLFFYPIQGQFNEYSGIFLYLSDIFLVLALIFWAYSILENKYNVLSRYRSVLANPAVFLPFLLVLWSFISIFWSHNSEIALFRATKMGEFFLLYLYVAFRIVPSQQQCSTWNIVRDKRGTIINYLLIIVVFMGLFQSVLGIWQFLIQHSIGLFWLKESLISSDIPGVAKIIFNGEKFIRAYGLFPHPNILGGFLVFSLFCSFLLSKMFHDCPVELNCSTWNRIIKVAIAIQLMTLLITFSKSAIIGFIIGIVYLIVSYGTISSLWGKVSYSLIKGRLLKILPFFLVLILALIIVNPDYYSIFNQSLKERSFYLNVSRGTIIDNWFGGIGMGHFVPSLEKVKNIENWQFQPVHNVFILITTELGIIGLTLFLSFLFYVWMSNVPYLTRESKLFHVEQFRLIVFRSVFIAFLFIIFFDHYLWDIQQGSFLLWITLGLIAGNKTVDEEKSTY